MKYLATYITTLFFLISVLSCTTTKPNQEDVMPPEQGKKQAIEQSTTKLELTITTEKQRYFIGEPVYITAQLRNVSNEEIKVFKYLKPGEGGLTLDINNDRGKNKQFTPLEEADHDKAAKIVLRPRQEIGEVFPVFFGGHGWSFPKNGQYELKAVYKTKIAEGKYALVSSNTLQIKISAEETEAITNMVSGSKASYQSGLFMTWLAGDHLTEGKEILSNVLKSNSPLNNYINLAFGKSYSEPFMDYREQEPREANYELAKRYLNNVESAKLPKYLQIQYHLSMAYCNYNPQVQDRKITLGHFDEIEKLLSDEIAYAGIKERIKEMRQRVK